VISLISLVHNIITGNLEDITLRAMNILRTADIVASEDTRHTGRLLQLLGIERKGQLLSHHEHNAQRRVPELVSLARVRWGAALQVNVQ
jgi:16S rRNA (cytidine1402-2'-O)-methyltransferase